MKNSLSLSAALLATSLFAENPKGWPASFKMNDEKAICFTENKGQVHDQYHHARPDVLFGGGNDGLYYHLTSHGVSYQLNRVDQVKKVKLKASGTEVEKIEKATIQRLDFEWLGMNAAVKVKGIKPLGFVSNYFMKNEPAVSAKSFEEVLYSDIYKGVDVRWYENNGELEYDYILAAGADYKQIRFEVKGADKIWISSQNELILETPLGRIVQKAPVVTQENKNLPAAWKVENGVVSFDIKNVNPAKPMIIDPVVRVWGTYYGGTGDDRGWSCAADNSGNVFLVGDCTTSTGTIIATVGSHQATIGGSYDAFVAKFNAAGVRQWATYYGGTGNEYEPFGATDASGNIYVAAYTNSNTGTVIATPGSHQATFGGGANDAFIVKFDASGVRQWGTYYGGSGLEYPRNICTDNAGNVYLVGLTSSTNTTAIATGGAHQTAYGGGTYDAFLVKLNSSGVRQWGTYYGGISDDRAYGCSVDGAGNVYFSGHTTSNANIASPGAHQTTFMGNNDGFLVKFNSSGVRQWATYYGDIGNELEPVCAADAAGNVYLLGYTTSNTSTMIATPGSYKATYGGSGDPFIVKFNSSGVRQWGSYYGGAGDENIKTAIVDPSGLLYFNGRTNGVSAATTIATPNGYQLTGGGGNDIYFGCFNQSGKLVFGSYYGSVGNEDSKTSSMALGNGYIYLSGITSSPSSTAIATPGSHQPTAGGSNDAFLAKFQLEGEALNFSSVSPGDNVVLPAAITSSLSTNNKITVEAWVRPTSLAGLGVIVGNYATPNNQMQFLLRRQNVNYVFFIGNGTGGGYTGVSSVAAPTLDVWQHIAGVWNGSVASLYVNGVFSGSTAISYTAFGNTSNSLIIGGNSMNENFNGDIDELRIWNRALCGTELQNNMNAELAQPQNGLTAYYKFNQGIAAANNATVTTAIDASPNAYTGTLTGFALNGYISNWIAPGGVLKNSLAPAYISPTVSITGPSTLCASSSATLTASGNVASYSWVNGPVTASNVVSPTLTTTYSVTGTNSLGCVSSMAMHTLTVFSQPTVSVNSGSICSGNSFTINPSGANTYTIQGGNTVVSPTANASYTVVGTSSAGCVSANTATSNVTVSASPTISVNSGSICSGNAFTINPSGANTYTIQGGNTIVSPTTNASYTVAGTSSAGCVSANTATSNVTVNANPTITVNSGSICAGNAFTINPSGANTYTIQGGNNVVSPGATTSYTVAGTNSAGCVSANTATSNVTVNPLPTVTAVSSETNFICVGQSATLSAGGASTYVWDNTSTTAVIVISPTVTTSYTVTGTDANGCQNMATVTQSVSSCNALGEQQAAADLISIYPNPSSGTFYLRMSAETSIQVFDMLGKSVIEAKLGSGDYQLSLDEYSKGMYMLRCATQNQIRIYRLIKE